VSEKTKKPKSAGLAIILAILFGPIGMIYVSPLLGLQALLVFIGLIMVNAIAVPLIGVQQALNDSAKDIACILLTVICIVYLFIGQPWWAAVKARTFNRKLEASACKE